MKTIQVYDKPMCCSTGVCGPQVDPVLPRFAADLQWLTIAGTSGASDSTWPSNRRRSSRTRKSINCWPRREQLPAADRGRWPHRESERIPIAGDAGTCGLPAGSSQPDRHWRRSERLLRRTDMLLNQSDRSICQEHACMEFLEHPTRILFFTGKGGVGKTSLACAAAVRLADAGKESPAGLDRSGIESR